MEGVEPVGLGNTGTHFRPANNPKPEIHLKLTPTTGAILIGSISTAAAAAEVANRTGGSPLVWQPLPLRATFRPLNRQAQSPPPPQPPQPPSPPRAPLPPSPPEPLALISERSISESAGENLFPTSNRFGNPPPSSSSLSPSSSGSSSFADDFFTPTTSARDNSPLASFFQPPPQTTTSTTPPPPPAAFDPTGGLAAPLIELPTTTSTTTSTTTTTTTTTTTPRPTLADDDDDLPTRQPLNRFRPTKAPSGDEGSTFNVYRPSLSTSSMTTNNSSTSPSTSGPQMSADCFECICEASTNCNPQSRCQTSDVRHTRCGMFLISYDQWLNTGLSRELVTREALARDAAADERAFYECVTNRDCSERLLAIYMARNGKDCDRDGRIDCYDYAAIHHSGQDKCASEALLDSQYWNDFNGCLGFGR